MTIWNLLIEPTGKVIRTGYDTGPLTLHQVRRDYGWHLTTP